MKVLILTVGSRGDVQPYVALGQGLKDAGHDVFVSTCQRFETFVSDHGLNYLYMNDQIMALMDSDQGREVMEETTSIFQVIKNTIKLVKKVTPLQREMLKDSWLAAEQCQPDLIIFHPKAYGGPSIAEKMRIPVILAIPLPMLVPTTQQPVWSPSRISLGGWFNKLTYVIPQKLMKFSVGKLVKESRELHGLPYQPKGFDILHDNEGKHIPVFHCYSGSVSPRPNDWPQNVVTTGYWFLQENKNWQPPDALQRFLEAGDPPVYVGFGSMAGRDPERLTSIVIKALQKANVRGIIATGWGGLTVSQLPDSIFKIDQVPHEWLFPKVAAVVHHGGAGSTAAGLRAGRPTIVCPFFGDQPYWGARVYALGVGSKPLPQKKLSVDDLAAAIVEVTSNQKIRKNAQLIGDKLSHENGVANALGIIENILAK
jgi:sterol 3beta-glucosyltransferase